MSEWTDRDDYEARCERIEAAQLMRDGASPLDLDAADEAWVELGRKRAAQRELAPSRTPQQRRADARGSQPFLTDGELALARIAKLEAHIDKLHDLIEQQQTGARHLAGRIDREEEERKAGDVKVRDNSTKRDAELSRRIGGLRKKIHGIFVDARNKIDANMAHTQTRLNRLEAQAKRVRDKFPSVAKEESGE